MSQMRGRFLEAVVKLYYAVPTALCWYVGSLLNGTWSWVLIGLGVAWPVGNIAIGVWRGCD